jgi:hypothetical protein
MIHLKGSGAYNILKSAAEMFGKKLTFDPDGNIVESNILIIVEQRPNILKIKYEIDYVQVYKKRN